MAKFDVYQMVTDKIVEMLDKGIIPWHKSWSGVANGAISYVSRKPYSLLNQMLLGRAGEYLTFNQIKQLGGRIKKGAKAGIIVFYTQAHYQEKFENEEGEIETRVVKYPLLKYFNVYHIDDCEGIESKMGEVEVKPVEPIAAAENVINGYLSREPKLSFQNDKPSDKAYYSYSEISDSVVVPMLSQYDIPEEYYSTTFHELTHSTMPAHRCDRTAENKTAYFGNEDYSREELVAEIGSAMLCNAVGIECDKAFKNSVAYIQSWLKALKNDKKMIIWASSRAEKAAKYILNINDTNKDE